jgi:hypothetical protein
MMPFSMISDGLMGDRMGVSASRYDSTNANLSDSESQALNPPNHNPYWF